MAVLTSRTQAGRVVGDLFTDSTDKTFVLLRLATAGGADVWGTAAKPAALTRLEDYIANNGDDYAVGEQLQQPTTRRILIGTTPVRIAYRGAAKAAVALDLAELGNWEYLEQTGISSTYPASALTPRGFLYRRPESGDLLQLRANTLLPAAFDASQWDTIAETVPTEVLRDVHEVAGILDSLADADAIAQATRADRKYFVRGVGIVKFSADGSTRTTERDLADPYYVVNAGTSPASSHFWDGSGILIAQTATSTKLRSPTAWVMWFWASMVGNIAH
jgi:hypothetical protein